MTRDQCPAVLAWVESPDCETVRFSLRPLTPSEHTSLSSFYLLTDGFTGIYTPWGRKHASSMVRGS